MPDEKEKNTENINTFSKHIDEPVIDTNSGVAKDVADFSQGKQASTIMRELIFSYINNLRQNLGHVKQNLIQMEQNLDDVEKIVKFLLNGINF